MSTPIAFESTWEKKKYKAQLETDRERVLAKAKSDFLKAEKKKEDARKRGEDTWMLPSVDARIKQEESSKSKKKKKKEKKKKEKKAKKKKNKRSKEASSAESSGSDEEPEWLECTASSKSHTAPVAAGPSEGVIKGPKLERDSWMLESHDFLPCVTRDDLRAERDKQKEEEKKKQPSLDELGQHDRELNPYWKDGGTGLPEENPQKKALSTAGLVADGGVGWWRRAHHRCKEEAKDSGRSLDDVAAERYGSLGYLESMLMQAERNAEKKEEEKRFERQSHRKQFQHSQGSSNQNRERRRSRSPDKRQARDQEDREEGRGYREQNKSVPNWKKRAGSKDRDRYRHREEPRFKDDRTYENSRGTSSDGHQESKKKYSHLFMKPGDDGKSIKNKFMKPGNDDNSDEDEAVTYNRPPHSRDNRNRYERDSHKDDSRDNRGHSSSYQRNLDRKSDDHHQLSSSNWRKKEFRRPDDSPPHSDPRCDDSTKKIKFSRPLESDSESSDSGREDTRTGGKKSTRSDYQTAGAPSWKKKEFIEAKRKASTSSSSQSEESGSDSENGGRDSPVIEIISEAEMNKLGARLVKAEIMGNTALAAEIKAKMEASRKAKASMPKDAAAEQSGARGGKQEEDEVVVLARIDRTGAAWPVEQEEGSMPASGRRRKKMKIATHSKSGKRERYFDDDDRHDLRALVEREKRSTAEDQNSMFASLAGRSTEKTDEDYQIDDIMVSKATRKKTDFMEEGRQRMQAISQHRKMSSALEKCTSCIENTQKHLIIAIGIKTYLCLPAHKSLSEGHCLIVPMQHSSAGTALDEDVWAEIQVFRKGLTKMFLDQGEDVVFMETAMHLKHHPHMYIECVPMPKEVGEMSPIYFKKAIQEVGPEWAQNKKLVDLSKKGIRHSVPKGFPYFSVDFGLEGGFAHVIEDERSFAPWFGREIVGGMLECDPTLWRKPHKEKFDEQRSKSLNFSKMWKPYDWTQQLKSTSDSDD